MNPVERIVVTKPVPGLDEALAQLPPEWQIEVNREPRPFTREELLHALATATGVVLMGDRLDAEAIAAAPSLRVISNYGVGVDNIDLDAAASRGIAVTNLPDEVTYSTAELTMALMLACVRRVCEADRFVRKHNPYPWRPAFFMGSNLQGKTLGLIGFGRIGQRVARLAQAFEMRVLYYSRTRRMADERALGAEYRDFNALLEEADILSLHVPATEATRRLIDREALARMKKSAFLINTSRGSVVDEAALAEALERGELAGAGLDVFEEEPKIHEALLRLENVVLTPHIGTSALEARLAMTRRAVANLHACLTGGEVEHRVV